MSSWKSSVTVPRSSWQVWEADICEGVDKVARFNGKNKLGFNSILAGGSFAG